MSSAIFDKRTGRKRIRKIIKQTEKRKTSQRLKTQPNNNEKESLESIDFPFLYEKFCIDRQLLCVSTALYWRGKYFRDKCAWISEGNFSSDPELFKTCVLVNMERYTKVLYQCKLLGIEFAYHL